jgi:hypothetical protein
MPAEPAKHREPQNGSAGGAGEILKENRRVEPVFSFMTE